MSRIYLTWQHWQVACWDQYEHRESAAAAAQQSTLSALRQPFKMLLAHFAALRYSPKSLSAITVSTCQMPRAAILYSNAFKLSLNGDICFQWNFVSWNFALNRASSLASQSRSSPFAMLCSWVRWKSYFNFVNDINRGELDIFLLILLT